MARDIGGETGIGVDMAVHETSLISGSSSGAAVAAQAEADVELRRGPWTVEEDLVLVNYITVHGQGRWNSLARSAGLKRSGKSCRLRWLNYLRPDLRRGNITPEEQLLILELQSRWGNRWSKIAQHLPGRTDNEIKNFWRTRVQKHAKQLKCDVNSQRFRDALRFLWVPRLIEKIQKGSTSSTAGVNSVDAAADLSALPALLHTAPGVSHLSLSPDHSSMAGSSSDSSPGTRLSSPPASDLTDCYDVVPGGSSSDCADEFPTGQMAGGYSESLLSPCGFLNQGFPDFEQVGWGTAAGFSWENLWADDDIWFLQQEL